MLLYLGSNVFHKFSLINQVLERYELWPIPVSVAHTNGVSIELNISY